MSWKPEVHVEGKWSRNGLVWQFMARQLGYAAAYDVEDGPIGCLWTWATLLQLARCCPFTSGEDLSNG